MNDLHTILGSSIADNWAVWTPAVRLALWQEFTPAQRQVIWANFRDQPDLCPEPPPVVCESRTIVQDSHTTDAMERFDQLIREIHFAPPKIVHPGPAELPKVEVKAPVEYIAPKVEVKRKPSKPAREPGGVQTVADLPLSTVIGGSLVWIGWAVLIWVAFTLLAHP